MTLGVVILDLDQAETTLRCLQSLSAGAVTPDVVVLVENGTSRVSRTALRDLDQSMDLVVLRPGRNLGCAGGRNLGLNYLANNTEVSTFMILDNDTLVPPKFISTVQATPMDPMEVIAPVITDMNKNTIWSTGGIVERNGTIEQLTTPPRSDVQSFIVDWSPGACLIFDQSTWERVGEFDHWMRFFFSDIDWCLRVGDLGGDVTIHRDLRIEHEGHLSLGGENSPARTRFWARNGTVFRLDTVEVSATDSLEWILSELQTSIRELGAGRFDHAKSRIQGLAEGARESLRRRRDSYEASGNSP